MTRSRLLFVAFALCAAWPLAGQSQVAYSGANVTGQLVLARTVNVLQIAQLPPGLQFAALASPSAAAPETFPRTLPQRLRPSFPRLRVAVETPPIVQALPISMSAAFGFNGLSHLDQRLANNGNQFSTEPANPAIAVANGYVLAGVNNAIQVYTESGTPLLPRVLSSNELFGLPPAINRVTGANGVFPTDMRVMYDHTIDRWFVVQQAQDNDLMGRPLPSSRMYVAVSQSSDPAGTYNIYTMDTTDAGTPRCPCFADYPQIGSDEHGFYISSNEFDTTFRNFVSAQIHAISKLSLQAGAATPTMYRFAPPFTSGFEFAIQPATTPPGASSFLGSGGLEYFVSTNAAFTVNNATAIWAIYNTGSLGTATPNPSLIRITVPTIPYLHPAAATQRPGPLPYGSSLTPPGVLAYLDSGDARVLSATYAGGRLYATFNSALTDHVGRETVGAGYVVFSPTFRNGTLGALVLRQGYVAASNNHVLYPSVAVNPRGRGGIAFTLVGPDYYPSAAFIAFDTFSTDTVIQVAGLGTAPEDGFTAYPGGFGPGTARWGDYSTAVAAADGAFWAVSEYIPGTPRTEAANWGTYIVRYAP